MKQIYMDYNATTPLHPEVKEEMIKTMDFFGNPSSLHKLGRYARECIELSREKIANFIGADKEEIVFVGSGSEANNTVLSMLSCCSKYCNYNSNSIINIITTKIEHPCILETAKCLKDRNIDVYYLDVDQYGKVDVEQLKTMINDKTRLVSVMMANNEIGTIQNIKKIADIVHEKNVLFHTDAVQAVGKIPINIRDLDVDFLTLSAHKIYGPKGIGALYIKKGIPFCPLIRGGHQEKGRRAGTENTLAIVGFAKAIEMREKEMYEESKKLLELKNFFKDEVCKRIKDVYFNGHPVDCLPGTINMSFDGAEGESILFYLDMEGIFVSTGSACASGSLDPSHVLLSTGISVERAHGSIRISLGRESNMDQIIYVVKKLEEVIKKVRKMSTNYKEEL